jgi:hypothetical protein
MEKKCGPIGMLLVLAFGTASNGMTQDELTLNGDAIGTLVKGKRLAGARTGGGDVRMKFIDTGDLSIQDGHAVETGKWSVRDDKLCLQVAKWNIDGCGKMVKAGAVTTLYFPGDEKTHIAFGK